MKMRFDFKVFAFGFMAMALLWCRPLVAATSGSCEEAASLVYSSTSKDGKTYSVTMTKEYDPDSGTYDPDSGVKYYKIQLTRGKPYVFWMTDPSSEDVSLDFIYPRDSSSTEVYTYPDYYESGVGYYYIGSTDWDPEDPSSWIYYISLSGEVGDTCTLHIRQAELYDVLPYGLEDKKEPITLGESGTITRAAAGYDEYWFEVALTEGDYYRFTTLNGSETNNVLVSLDAPDNVSVLPTCTYLTNGLYNVELLARVNETATNYYLSAASDSDQVSFEYHRISVGSVGFEKSAMTVSGTASTLDIKVTRTSSDVAYKLYYGTIPLTARGGYEYKAQDGVLDFAVGELEKTITLTMYPNNHGGEANGRQFGLRLTDNKSDLFENEYSPGITCDRVLITLSDGRAAGTTVGAYEDEIFDFYSRVTYDGNGCDDASVVPPAASLANGTTFVVSSDVIPSVGQMKRSGWEFLNAWTGSDGRDYASGETVYAPLNDLTLKAKWSMSTKGIDAALDCAGKYVFVATGNAPWVIDTSDYASGGSSARSDKLGNNQRATLQTTITGKGFLSLMYKVSSASGDNLTIVVDTKTVLSVSGEIPWTNFQYELANEGDHTVVFSYSKNASGTSGRDCAWIDQLLFDKASTVTIDLNAAGDQTLTYKDEAGNPYPTTFNRVINSAIGNLPVPKSDERTFDHWEYYDAEASKWERADELTLVTADGLQLRAEWRDKEWEVSFDLNGGVGTVPESQFATVGNTITFPTDDGFFRTQFEFAGWLAPDERTYFYPATYTLGKANIKMVAQWSYSVDGFAEALATGSPYDIVEKTFRTDGAAGWYPEDGTLRSGKIGNSQSTWVECEVTLETPGFVSFLSKYSTERGADFYRFYLDNQQGTFGSGTTDWYERRYELSPGTHVLRWVYEKNGSGLDGSDCAWIDDLVIGRYLEVEFKANHEGVADPTNIVCNIGDTFVDLPVPQCPTNTFFVWKDEDGYTYENGDSVPALTSNLVLFAQWIGHKEYRIAYDVSSADPGCETPLAESVQSGEEIFLPKPEDYGIARAGYVFTGWSDGSAVYPAGSPYRVGTTDVTFVPAWTAKRHLTFVRGDDSATGEEPHEIVELPGTTVTLPSGDGLSLAGAEFFAWTGNGRLWSAGSKYTVPDEDQEFAAAWDFGAEEAEKTAFVDKGVICWKATKSGGSWDLRIEQPSGTANGISANKKSATMDVCMVGAGTVTFDYQVYSTGGKLTLTVDGTSTSYSSATSGTFTRKFEDGGLHSIRFAYVFRSGTGQAIIKNFSWDPAAITVTFDAGGGEGTVPAPIQAPCGQAFALPGCGELYKDGFEFAGWTDEEGNFYYEGDLCEAGADDLEFTAVWEEIVIPPEMLATVTFVSGKANASFATSNVTYVIGEPFGELPVPTCDGYEFAYWRDADDNVIRAEDFVTQAMTGATFYAEWEFGEAPAPVIGGTPVEDLELAALMVNSKTPMTLVAEFTVPDGNSILYGNSEIVLPEYYRVSVSEPQGDVVIVSVELDETKVTPTVDATAETPFAVGEETVSVAVGNAWGGLWYALSSAATPSDEFVVDPSTCRQAAYDGESFALEAARNGAHRFYRIVVTDLEPK